MKVELKTILAGPDGNGQPGDVVDMDPDRAKSMINSGSAVEVSALEKAEEKPEEPESIELETATDQAEETAVSGERRKPRKPRRGN